MATFVEEERKKREFVEANPKLFEDALVEERARGKNKPYGPKYLKFVNRARKRFKYSDRTSNVDIWTKFQFQPIMQAICDRLKAKHLQKPEIKRALGYGKG